jgi:myo-inositol-1(or 4)-monophosphatase
VKWWWLVADRTDLELLIEAARIAGGIARKYFYKDDVKSWDKSENNPVTEADIAVNNYLSDTLQSARPDYGWLSEETKDDASRHAAARTFVVDPIDGTRAFMDGRPHFTVCLAVIENGKSIAGVVYNPILEEMFEAELGRGAFLNGRPIQPSTCGSIPGCTLIGYPRKFRRMGWPDMSVSIRNSMAYRIAMVAAGLRDGTVSFTPKSDWDLAAASLIAAEAGAVITDISGENIHFAEKSTSKNGVICAGPALHPLLLQQVKSGLAAMDAKKMETKMSDHKQAKKMPEQLLHLVIGGELVDPMKTEFINLKEIDFRGAYPNYAAAYDAWKNAAQSTVDNAHMRYFILHAHELIDPDNDGIIG